MFQGAESVPGSLGGGRRDTRLLLVVPALGQTYGTLPLPAGPCCCAWQAGACPESRGVGGAAPDGLSCLQEAHVFSLLTYGVWAAWVWWACYLNLRLLLRGGNPRKLLCQPSTHVSSPQVCPIIPSNTHTTPAKFPIPVMPQHPKAPGAPLPTLHRHSSPLDLASK